MPAIFHNSTAADSSTNTALAQPPPPALATAARALGLALASRLGRASTVSLGPSVHRFPRCPLPVLLPHPRPLSLTLIVSSLPHPGSNGLSVLPYVPSPHLSSGRLPAPHLSVWLSPRPPLELRGASFCPCGPSGALRPGRASGCGGGCHGLLFPPPSDSPPPQSDIHSPSALLPASPGLLLGLLLPLGSPGLPPPSSPGLLRNAGLDPAGG